MAAITTQRAWRLRQEFRTQTEARMIRDEGENARAVLEAAMTARLRAGLRNADLAEVLDGWSMLPALVVEKIEKRRGDTEQ